MFYASTIRESLSRLYVTQLNVSSGVITIWNSFCGLHIALLYTVIAVQRTGSSHRQVGPRRINTGSSSKGTQVGSAMHKLESSVFVSLVISPIAYLFYCIARMFLPFAMRTKKVI